MNDHCHVKQMNRVENVLNRTIKIDGDWEEVAGIAHECEDKTEERVRSNTLNCLIARIKRYASASTETATTAFGSDCVSSSSGAVADVGGVRKDTRPRRYDPTPLHKLNPGAGTEGFAGSYVPGESSLDIPAQNELKPIKYDDNERVRKRRLTVHIKAGSEERSVVLFEVENLMCIFTARSKAERR